MTLPADERGDLAEAWEKGRAAWPSVDLPFERFSAHVSAIAGDAAGVGGAGIADLHVTDLYLACACGHGMPTAVAALEREHLRHVPRFLRKITTDPALADEVLQAVRTKLLVAERGRPKIFEYAGRGSLGAFVRVTAIRTAQSMLRRHDPLGAAAPEDEVDRALGSPLDPEMSLLRARIGPEVGAALRESIQALTPMQRNVLRLHYFDGLSFERIGGLFGVNRATACRWTAEARRKVVMGTRQLLTERLALSNSALDSATRLLRSQLDVSLSGLFRAEDGGARRAD